MPKLQADENVGEIYLCTVVRLPQVQETLNVIRFDPHSRKENVHHMALYICADTDPNLGNI